MRGAGIALLACMLVLGAVTGRAGEDPGKQAPAGGQAIEGSLFPIRAPALGLAGSIRFPDHWGEDHFTSAAELAIQDPDAREKLEAALERERLPDAGFAVEFLWSNAGDVLAISRLRIGRENYAGTVRQLADRCVAEIRARWPSLKGTKPAFTQVGTAAGTALYVKLEDRARPPYRVHFAALLVDGKACVLSCYGWGPQVTVVDLTGGAMSPRKIREVVEEGERLSPEALKQQERYFREFETMAVPSLRLGRPAADAAKPDPAAPPPR